MEEVAKTPQRLYFVYIVNDVGVDELDELVFSLDVVEAQNQLDFGLVKIMHTDERKQVNEFLLVWSKPLQNVELDWTLNVRKHSVQGVDDLGQLVILEVVFVDSEVDPLVDEAEDHLTGELALVPLANGLPPEKRDGILVKPKVKRSFLVNHC